MRVILSFAVSFLLISIASYGAALHRCPEIVGGIERFTKLEFIYSNALMGTAMGASVIFSLIVYDIMTAILYWLGIDKELNELKMRPGRGAPSPEDRDVPPPFPIGVKWAAYFLFALIVMYLVTHEVPNFVCDLSLSKLVGH